MEIRELYEMWLKNAVDDSDLIAELNSISDKAEDIRDRFYRELKFGTAGLRGVIGAGTNRMNVLTFLTKNMMLLLLRYRTIHE